MFEILSAISTILSFGLTIYQLFVKKEPESVGYYTQNILIQQINPRYNFQIYNPAINKTNIVNLQNAHWKARRTSQCIIYLIYLSLIINTFNYFKTNTLKSISDFTSLIYLPLTTTLIQLSIIIIIFCIIFIIRGWEKNKSNLYNLVSMKYFSIKIITDCCITLSLSLISKSFIEKVNSNLDNFIYSFSLFGLVIQLLLQIMWIQFTISKLFKSIPTTYLYKEKEKQLLTFIPAYLFSIVFSILIIYIKLF